MVTSSEACPALHRGGAPMSCLLRHSAAWALSRGYPPPTETQIREWRRAGLIPPPDVHALGRGSTSAWSPVAYRRILAIVRLRHRGLRATTGLRVGLWLAGHRLAPHDVLADFDSEIRRVVKSALTQMGVTIKPRHVVL